MRDRGIQQSWGKEMLMMIRRSDTDRGDRRAKSLGPSPIIFYAHVKKTTRDWCFHKFFKWPLMITVNLIVGQRQPERLCQNTKKQLMSSSVIFDGALGHLHLVR